MDINTDKIKRNKKRKDYFVYVLQWELNKKKKAQ